MTGDVGVKEVSFDKLGGVAMFEMSCLFANVFVEMCEGILCWR